MIIGQITTVQYMLIVMEVVDDGTTIVYTYTS